MPKKRARGGVTGSSAPAPKRTRFATTSQAEDASTTSSERPQRSATKENSAMKAPTTRGRGRPPKSRTPSETPDPAPPATRGRGRPRQSSTPRETPGIAHQNGIPEDASTEEDVKSARKSKPKQQVEVEDDFEEDGTQYWLMKAEPDSRIENGKDVAFSIDMLRDREEPEPWDGLSLFRQKTKTRLTLFRCSQSSCQEQHESYEERRSGFLLSFQLQETWYCRYHGNCAGTHCRRYYHCMSVFLLSD